MKNLLNYKGLFILTVLVSESAVARGWHSISRGPEWYNQLLLAAFVFVLLLLFIKSPIKTILVGGLLCLAAGMLWTFQYIDKSFGPIWALFSLPIMWLAILKLIDLSEPLFEDKEKD